MEIDTLILFLRTVIIVNASLEAAIREQVITVRYRKGQIIASPDRRADQLWFISEGMAKEYYYDASGKMVVTAFWRADEFMMIAESFFGKRSSDRYIELIEDSVLLVLHSRQAHLLNSLYPDTQQLLYALAAAAAGKANERLSLTALSAAERNRRFRQLFPQHRMSVADAASFLGLARETLTHIRRVEAKHLNTKKKQ